MYNPTTRLLTILELLQSRGSITGPELARRLEVKDRSIRRYITMLRDMGIPIDAERGREGAYMLRPGYRLPPLMFNDDEMLAVFLGLMIGRKLAVVESAGIESAMAKIERVLPLELRQRIWALQSVLTVDLKARVDAPAGAVVAVLGMASHRQSRVYLEYRTPRGEETKREFDPYGVVYHAGLWYTVGYCHMRRDVRVFRLDRIQAIALREESFERPDDFDVLAYVQESIAMLPGGWVVEVLLKVSMEEARRVVPPDTATLEARTQNDGVLMRCTTNNLDWIARFLTWTGCPFEILQPDALRDEVRRLGQRLLQTAEVS